jgi:hypothetical protein
VLMTTFELYDVEDLKNTKKRRRKNIWRK